jgi:hypothetical protein
MIALIFFEKIIQKTYTSSIGCLRLLQYTIAEMNAFDWKGKLKMLPKSASKIVWTVRNHAWVMLPVSLSML